MLPPLITPRPNNTIPDKHQEVDLILIQSDWAFQRINFSKVPQSALSIPHWPTGWYSTRITTSSLLLQNMISIGVPQWSLMGGAFLLTQTFVTTDTSASATFTATSSFIKTKSELKSLSPSKPSSSDNGDKCWAQVSNQVAGLKPELQAWIQRWRCQTWHWRQQAVNNEKQRSAANWRSRQQPSISLNRLAYVHWQRSVASCQFFQKVLQVVLIHGLITNSIYNKLFWFYQVNKSSVDK